MDASQWSQPHQVGGIARTMGEIQPPPTNISNNMMDHTSTNNSRGSPMVDQRRARPQKEQNLNCPRCNSTNTKFCYYNNYSLTQPRYFCKTCRRYWTQGGSLRNVPVGGGSRKNKRPSSSSPSMILGSSSSSGLSNALTPTMGATKLIPDLNPPNTLPHLITPQNPSKFLEAQDLNLAFPMQGIFSGNESDISNSTPTTTTPTTAPPVSALELLKSGIPPRGSLSSYVSIPIPDPNSPLYSSGLPNLQEFKPNVGVFQAAHHGGDHGNGSNGDQNNGMISGANNVVGGARLLFPFADMNKLASSAKTANYDHDTNDQINDQSNKGGNHDIHQHHHHLLQQHHQGQTGYWTGMLGGGAW